VDNFSIRREHITTKRTEDKKTNLQHQAPSSSFASSVNRLGGDGRGKRTSAFTIFVTASVIATLFLLPSPSFHFIPQAHAQGAPLNPATTQIINQIASQVANAFGGDTVQVAQVLEQIAVQISQDANPGKAIQSVSQIFGQMIIGGNQAPVSQALFQLAQQQASGQNIQQAISQIGQQVAQGGDVTQAIVQASQQSTQPQGGGATLPSEVRQEITQIATQVAQGTNTDQGQVDQVLQQIATQTAAQGGNAEQTVTQVGQQVAENPQGPVSQSIAQIAKQQDEGENVQQQITQIGQQVATGAPATQVIIQVAVQVAVGQNANQEITQVAQQVASGTGTEEGQVPQIKQ
jgi:F0F1-type ATP synthase delta subunit